jgi:glycosyltransferase involved in cell wall biosynthesis
MSQPFFSIGITTYNRHALLKEALASILSQGFADFEVIVGNDYQAEVLTGEMLGISDPRIRFINHPRNLREVGNMNALLAGASGRYFTWLFDDDLYEPGFLQTAHDVLVKTGFPPALFPSYRVVKANEVALFETISYPNIQEFTGRQYLRRYFSGRLKIISTCGLFDTKELRSTIGGMERLAPSAIGLNSEFHFLVKCALLGRIAFMDARFVVFRAHEASWTVANTELDTYHTAGPELVRRCAEVLRHPTLFDDLAFSLRGICKLHIIYPFALKAAAFHFLRGGFGFSSAYHMLSALKKEVSKIRKLYVTETGDNGYYSKLFFLVTHIKAVYIALHALELAWAKKPKD